MTTSVCVRILHVLNFHLAISSKTETLLYNLSSVYAVSDMQSFSIGSFFELSEMKEKPVSCVTAASRTCTYVCAFSSSLLDVYRVILSVMFCP